jgi:hypothetical protein
VMYQLQMFGEEYFWWRAISGKSYLYTRPHYLSEVCEGAVEYQ